MFHIFLSNVKSFFVTYTDIVTTITKNQEDLLQILPVTQEVVECVACV